MKKFVWRLQRVLDLKEKQESALRNELMGITEQIVGVRGQIMMKQTMIRSQMREIQNKTGQEKIIAHQMFLQHIGIIDNEIKLLNEKLSNLEQLRQRKMDDMLKLRKMRKGLERLRTQAREDYVLEMNKQEQNHLDETSNSAFARKMIQEQLIKQS